MKSALSQNNTVSVTRSRLNGIDPQSLVGQSGAVLIESSSSIAGM